MNLAVPPEDLSVLYVRTEELFFVVISEDPTVITICPQGKKF